jgi:replication factor C subunit 2/4
MKISNLPWTEKYKPKFFDELLLEDLMMTKLKNIISCTIIPNLLIYGPSGSGKTVMIYLFMQEIFKKNYKEAVLELNSSSNRGLETINSNIIYFCKKKISSKQKLIILDEADNITKKAQNLLNNMIEEYTSTNFCLICNDSTKIIESIQSKCIILKLNAISDEKIYDKLVNICKAEHLQYESNGLKTIVDMAQGDIRYAINNLQAIYYSFGKITEKNIYKICYQPNPDQIINIIRLVLKKDIKSVINELLILKQYGYCNFDIIQTLLSVLRQITINESIRITFIKVLSEYYIKINDGNDTNLQLYAALSKIIQLIRQI